MPVIPALAHIPNQQNFLEQCHLRQYPARAAIIHAGDASDSLFFIVKGSVSVVIEDDEGREMVVAYLNAGDFVNGYINAFLIDGVTELMRHGWARRRGVTAGGSRAQAVAASAISALVIVAVELFPSTLNRPEPADVPAGIVGALLYLGVRLFALGWRLQVKPTL